MKRASANTLPEWEGARRCMPFPAELREAHTDAVSSENEFAKLALFSLIEQAAEMQTKLARVKDAAMLTNTGAAKNGKAK